MDLVAGMERDLRKYELSDEKLENFREVNEFLAPFASVSEHIEGYKYPTLSFVVPLYYTLLTTLSETSVDLKFGVETRLTTTILDCRLKLDFFRCLGWELEQNERGEKLTSSNHSFYPSRFDSLTPL